MMTNDLVNGCFEFVGAAFILNHCRILYRAKILSGVSILSTIYFFSWGFWNLFFYPSLNQMWSFYGGIAIMAANTLWIGMMIYYKYRAFEHYEYKRPEWKWKIKGFIKYYVTSKFK